MSEPELREQLSLRSFGKVRKLYKRTRERFGPATQNSTAHAVALTTPEAGLLGGQQPFNPSASGPAFPRMPNLSPGIPPMQTLVLTPSLTETVRAGAEVRVHKEKDVSRLEDGQNDAPIIPVTGLPTARTCTGLAIPSSETVADLDLPDRPPPPLSTVPQVVLDLDKPSTSIEPTLVLDSSETTVSMTDIKKAVGRAEGAVASVVRAASTEIEGLITDLDAAPVANTTNDHHVRQQVHSILGSDERKVEAQLMAEGSCIGKLNWVVNSKLLPTLSGTRGWGSREYEDVRLRELQVQSDLGQGQCDADLIFIRSWGCVSDLSHNLSPFYSHQRTWVPNAPRPAPQSSCWATPGQGRARY